MKLLLTSYAILVGLAVAWVNPAPLAAQEWSPAQREVLEALHEFTQISMRGDVEEIMGYFHTDFRAWDYAQGLPLDRGRTQGMFEYWYAKYQQVGFDVQPVAIQLHGDVAIAHLYYQEVMRDAAAVDVIISGRWTATLVKQGDGWVFLCWTWVQDET